MNRRGTSQYWGMLSLALLLSCVSDPPIANPASRKAPDASAVDACPLGVAGTRIALEDSKTAPNGIDVTFTTRPESQDRLRARAREQAERRGPGSREGRGHDGAHGLHHEHGMRLWDLPASKVEVRDVERGVVLTLTPIGDTTRADLRTALTRRVAYLEAQGCRE